MTRPAPSLGGFGHILDPNVEISPRDQLRERLQIVQAKREERLADFYNWAVRLPEPKTGPLDFGRFAFQRELYSESAFEHEAVITKSTQVGASAWLVRWALYFADVRGLTSLYVMPKKGQVFDFCLHEDERILMVDGTTKRIADVQVGDLVWSSNGREVVPDEVTHTWDRGQGTILEIKLAGGGRLRPTANHEVFTSRGWVEAGDLAAGDYVCVPHLIGGPGEQTVSVDDAFLLALWLAEGSKGSGGYFATCGNPEVVARAQAITRRRGWHWKDNGRFGFTIGFRPGGGRTPQGADTPGNLLITHGCRGQTTSTISVPEAIMRGDQAVVEEFIRTYIACDGHVGRKEVTIASASERLIRDLRTLAMRVGLVGTVRVTYPKYPGAYPSWTLAFAGHESRARLRAIAPYGKPVSAEQGDPRRGRPATQIDGGVVGRVHEAHVSGVAQTTTAALLGVSQTAISRALKRVPLPVAPLGSAWAKVVEINEIGRSQTHDLTTREHHCFFTESALTHNSDSRLKRIILASDYLKSRVSRETVANKGLKAVGLGLIYMRGSESTDDLQSIDADTLALDEYDDLCLAEGTLVLTRAGYTPIEDVRPSDEVLTHRGRWQRVTRTSSRPEKNMVRVVGQGVPGLHATPDHPVYARRRDGSADNGADLPVVAAEGQSPRPCTVPDCERRVAARDYCGAHYQRWRKHGDPQAHVPVKGVRRWGERERKVHRTWTDPDWCNAGDLNGAMVAQVLPPVEPDGDPPEWWWFVGRYLADGCCDRYSVHIDCSSAEADELEARLRLVADNVKRKPYKGARATRFTISSRALVARLEPYGRLATGKRLTGHALALDAERSEALLYGYLSGDGSYDETRKLWSASSVSKGLALGMALLVQRVHGVVASCFECRPPSTGRVPRPNGASVDCKPSVPYRISFGLTNNGPFTEGELGWKAIRSVERSTAATVYDLTVEEDHSFMAEGCVVHNSQENIPDAERRLSGSREPRIRRVGVPSIPDFGLDKLYQESDMRRWYVKCQGCKLDQTLDFWENLDQQQVKIVCKKCRKPLDVTTGRWVAEFPDREIRGYHIHRLMVPGRIGLEQVIKSSKKTRPFEVQTFWNKDLGLAYAHSEGRLSKEAIAAAQRDDIHMVESYNGGALVTMGVDVASTRPLTVRISEHLPDGRRRALWIGEVKDFTELGKMMDRYQVNMACIDHLPEGRLARGFANKFAGRVYLVAYSATQKDVVVVDDDQRRITVRRVETLDATQEQIRKQLNLLPKELPENYVSEMQSPVRVAREDEVGKQTVVYQSAGPDDFTHAEAYDVVAWEAWRIRQAVGHEVIQPLDDILDFERTDFEEYDDVEYSAGYE